MDNKKRIRDLTNTTTAPENTDFLVLDNGTTNKITRANLLAGTPLPANTVDTQAIEDDAVTTNKVADDAITPNKIDVGAQTAVNNNSGDRNNAAYGTLASDTGTNPGVTVTVPASGAVLVLFTTRMIIATAGAQAFMSVSVSGANTIDDITSLDEYSLSNEAAATNDVYRNGNYHYFVGLTPGSTTFTLVYRTSAGNCAYSRRSITAIPIA